MSDAISQAIQLTKKNASGIASSAASQAASTAAGAAAGAASTAIGAATSAIPPSVSDNLKKLPTTKDPELVKAQAKAEAQKIKGELQNKVEQEKEKKIEELKDKVASFVPPAIAAVAVFPIIDPKLLATIAYLKAQQELREAKQKMSKQNLKKAKENFTFPMKPPTRLSSIPKIPEVPKIPELPKLPPIPKLPTSLSI